MKAGDLTQRIVIQQKSVTRDSYGAEVITWADVATVWAAAEPISGREYIAIRAAQSDVTTRFRMRYRAGITTAMRVQWRDGNFDILEVIDKKGRKVELELLARAEATPT